MASRARNEAALNFCELTEAELFHHILEWQVFAKRHQVQLVVDRQYAAIVIDDVDRVVGARHLDAGLEIVGRAHRARDQYAGSGQDPVGVVALAGRPVGPVEPDGTPELR